MAAIPGIYSELASSTTVTAGTSSDVVTIAAASQSASTQYLVLAFAKVEHGSGSYTECLSLRNESTTVSNSFATVGNGTDRRKPWVFMEKITTDGSPTDITIRVDAPAGAGNTTVSDAWIVMIDLDTLGSSNWAYAEDHNNETLTTATTDGASITFTPDQEEDWLVLSWAELLGSFSTHRISHWIDLDAATETTPLAINSQNGSITDYMQLIGRIYTLDASEHTLLNQFSNSSTTFSSAKRADGIFAVRLDAFDGADSAYTAAESNFSGAALEEKQTVSFAAPSTGAYLILGGCNFDGSTDDSVYHGRIQVDGSDITLEDGSTEMHTINSTTNYEPPIFLGGVEALTSGTRTIDLDVSCSNSDGAAEERWLAVLGPIGAAAGGASLAVTRTDMTETEVRENSMSTKTIVLTLTDTTWASTIGGCNVLTEQLLACLDSDGADPLGWDAVVIGGQYGAIVLDDSPVAYWPCDETSGSTIADGVGSNDGTLTIIGAGNGESLHGKKHRPSLNFNTGLFIGPQLQVADNSAIQNIWGSGGSLEFAIDPNDPAVGTADETFGRIMDKGTWNVWMNQLDGGVCALNFGHDFSGNDGHWYTNVVMEVGVPHHVVILYDSSSTSNDPTIYIDGVAQTVTEGTAPTGTASTDVGSTFDVGGTQAQAMRISDIAMYTDSLTEAEVIEHLTALSSPIGLSCEDVVRTSDTVVTITIPDEFHIFDIYADETVSACAPGATQASGSLILSADTFDITVDNSTSGYSIPPGNGTPSIGNGLPYGGFNGGLGYDVITASKQLGLGDTWVFGISLPFIGHEVDNPTDRTIMVQGVAIHEAES